MAINSRSGGVGNSYEYDGKAKRFGEWKSGLSQVPVKAKQENSVVTEIRRVE